MRKLFVIAVFSSGIAMAQTYPYPAQSSQLIGNLDAGNVNVNGSLNVNGPVTLDGGSVSVTGTTSDAGAISCDNRDNGAVGTTWCFSK
jgi:hypothetical protein